VSTLGDIVAALTSGCASIKTTSGYSTTVKTASEFRTTKLMVADLPACDVRESEDSTLDISLGSDEGGADAANEEHELLVDVECSAATASAARALAFDVRKMIRDTLTDTYDILPVSMAIDGEQEESKIVNYTLRFRVHYNTGLFDAT
jgi:hypothetical protein